MILVTNSFNFNSTHKHFLTILVCILAWKTCLLGQSATTLSKITTEQGLGFRNVNHVTQDQQGLIWISTQKGLERYDGNEFVTYNDSKTADIKCPLGQASMVVPNFLHHNILLVLSNEKLYTIDLCDNSISRFMLPAKYEEYIRHIYYAPDQTLYISANHKDTQFFIQYRHNQFKELSSIHTTLFYGNDMAVDSKGNLWSSNIQNTIEKFNNEGTLLYKIRLDSFIWFEKLFYFSKLFIDPDTDDVYIFPKSKNEIWLYNEIDKSHIVIKDSLSSPVYCGLKDNLGNIWFSTKTQLFKYNKSDKLKPFQDYTALLQELFSFTRLHNLFIDKGNVLWIATNNGIIKMPLNKQLFEKLLYHENQDWSNEMRGIAQSKNGDIFAFCENGRQGLYNFTTQDNGKKLITHSVGMPKQLDGIRHMVYDQNKEAIWCVGRYFCRIDATNGQIDSIDIDTKEFSFSQHHSPIALLTNGNLIFGYKCSHLAVYNPDNDSLDTLFVQIPNAEAFITEFFAEDNNGNIWIGTNQGIIIIDNKGNVVQRINENTIPALSNNNCLSYHRDSQNRIWIGTFGGGINILTKGKKGQFSNTIIDKNAGLCDNNITALLEDNEGNIWASTYFGLSKIEKSFATIQNFYMEDGLTHNEFNYSSSLKAADGRLWFGGLNGITVIDPMSNFKQKSNPPLVLTSYSSFDRSTNHLTHVSNGLENRQQFIFSPNISWFQFNWSLPNYFNSEKNKYFIWLEGLDNTWSYHGNSPYIRYYNLKHGNYILHIKGTDSKGNPSAKDLSFAIVVQPYFYQTWWFTLLCIAFIGLLFYALYKYNLNKKLEMERMRTQIASDLHDEVGSMLSGLAMQSELLQSDQLSPMNSKLQNIADLSRHVVGKMRDLVWSIDSRSDTINDLIDKMHDKMVTMLEPKEIAFHIDVQDVEIEKTLPVMSRQQLFLIFNEAITNVVRHSNATKVVVKISNQPQFVMQISDNGTSLPSHKKPTGYGLKNMQMRAAKINAQVIIAKDNGYDITIVMKKI